jgi:hypothetical protein
MTDRALLLSPFDVGSQVSCKLPILVPPGAAPYKTRSFFSVVLRFLGASLSWLLDISAFRFGVIHTPDREREITPTPASHVLNPSLFLPIPAVLKPQSNPIPVSASTVTEPHPDREGCTATCAHMRMRRSHPRIACLSSVLMRTVRQAGGNVRA